MNTPPRPEIYGIERILFELGEIHGEVRAIAAGVAEHAQQIHGHTLEIEKLKLDGATRQGSSQIRDKWAGRLFAVLPPILAAGVGFGLGHFIR